MQFTPESKTVAMMLIWLEAKLNNHPATWILAAAAGMHGTENRSDELAVLLCTAIEELTDDQMHTIVLNPRDEDAVRLAAWYASEIKGENESDGMYGHRPEFKSFTNDGRNVIVDLKWYERAVKIMRAFEES